MNKRSITILAGLVCLIAIALFVFNKTPDYGTPKNTTIVAFGDSLIQGVGTTLGNDLPSLISKEMGLPIINEGRSGDTTEMALTRLPNIIRHNPGIVIVLLGGNDYLRRVPVETTFQNLDTIVTELKNSGSIVVLLGVRGGLLKDNYDDNFEAFAKKHHLPFVSNVLKNILGDDELMHDQIHPNDKGYKIIAERVVPVIEELLEKR